MVSVVAIALWTGGIAAPVRTLALAAAVVLVADPWAPLAPGFWLSFAAVALIFYVAAGWSGREPRVAQWVRVQWAITVGLAPAVLLLFGQVSLAGPLANAVAIPVVSVIVTPLALLAAVIPLDFILELAARLVEWLLQFLELCSVLPGALWQQHAPAPWAVALALAGALWVLAPRGVPGRGCGLALMAPAFLLPPGAPPPGEAWITAFDVGQGLAVVVRTATRTLVYDAGPVFGAEADSGARILVPELRAAGAKGVDLMVLTHEDTDHIGGALSVLESVEVQELASSLPQAHALNALVSAPRRCLAGERWDWDGVRFSFLHPRPEDAPVRRNNQSCVMRIEAGGASMLLTGDIERLAELSLVNHPGLRADVVLVPHHGSRTSSSPEFVAAVAPRWAIVTAGYRNRFGHPNAQVLERYASAGTSIFRTDRDGAIHVLLKSAEVRVEAERSRRPRYWRAAPPV
jgi:competence protein ComEC